jgi:phosphoglycolate phosphatase (TIGR01487 family)
LKFRGVVTDVDGTITDGYPVIDFDAASVLRNLEREGCRVVLASGRAAWELYSLSMFLGLCRVVVAENGAVVLNKDPMTMKMLADSWEPLRALAYLEKNLPGVRVKRTLPRFTEVVLERTPEVHVVRRSLEESHIPVKVLDSGYAYHVVCKHVEKSLGVREALNILDIDPSKTVAVGDSETDVSLFKLCGLGIAVANADDEAKRNASYVTKGSGGQGLVEAINYAFDHFEPNRGKVQ